MSNVTDVGFVLAKFLGSKSFNSVLGSSTIETPGGGSELSDYAHGAGKFFGYDLPPGQMPGEP